MSRTTHGAYDDPLDLIWRRAAERLGMSIVLDPEVYASWDGRGALHLCPPDDYDADDSLAQLVLHEICHALVQGPRRRRQVDWGLDNSQPDASALAEHACHRLQAALLDRYGLRALLSVTTDWRPYWDALPDDPLAEPDDPACALARAAWPEATRGPWSAALDEALRATAALAKVVRPLAPDGSLWRLTRPLTPVGLAEGPAQTTCGTCAWATPDGADTRCRHLGADGLPGPVVDPSWKGCVAWERVLVGDDCTRCGACCRQAFNAVEVTRDEALATSPLVREREERLEIPRPHGFCVALETPQAPWRCTVYDDRPRSCRDFAIGGAHCLVARRRVGLSRM